MGNLGLLFKFERQLSEIVTGTAANAKLVKGI